MSEKFFQIAIDGPSGAGKSTVAKAVAKKLGIDYIQGYYFSKPVDKKEFIQFVKANTGQK